MKQKKIALTPGKEFLGKIKSYVQDILKLDPQKILNVTPALANTKFKDILQESQETEAVDLSLLLPAAP
jgi:hypothetical protein